MNVWFVSISDEYTTIWCLCFSYAYQGCIYLIKKYSKDSHKEKWFCKITVFCFNAF